MDAEHYSATTNLRDGRRLLIRAIRPDDKTAVEEGFQSLDDRSVYLRFFAPKREVSEEEVRAATEIDFVHQVALIALLLENHSSRFVGACRYVVYDPSRRSDRAEYASAVLPAYQGLGIGTILFQHLVHVAKASGINYLEADVLQHNKSMIRLLTNRGFPVEKSLDGSVIHLSLKIGEKS